MIEHFIANEFVPAADGRSFETLNATANQPIEEVAAGSAQDVDRAVKAARRAFDSGPWPRMSAKERAVFLGRIAEAIEARADDTASISTQSYPQFMSPWAETPIPRLGTGGTK